ncbi:MAG TPA: hypothetical protein VF820_01645 [Patescibacteria group bacterium]
MKRTLFYKVLLVTILLVTLSFILPIPSNKNIDVILVPATFIFGAIYSFEILKVIGNFSELKKLLSILTANLVYMYHAATIIGGDFTLAVQEKIEKYILSSIDYSLAQHISSTDQDFLSLIDPIESLEPKNDRHRAALSSVTSGFHKVLESRYQLAEVAPREISAGEWLMMILLAFILVVTLFLGREAGVLSQFSAGVFAATIVGTLLLLDEADSNQLQETRLEYEIFNQVLEDIGKLPYYPQFAIKKGVVKVSKGYSYRMGVFPKYPNLSVREIQEVNA